MLLHLVSIALAKDLVAGELGSGGFGQTGYTIPQGEFALHPLFYPSSYGLSDHFELQSSLLGLIGGPNLGAKLTLSRGDGHALAVAAGASYGWTGVYGAGGSVIYTLGGETSNRLNLEAGADYVGGTVSVGGVDVTYDTLNVPIAASYDVVASPQTTWTFGAHTNVAGLATGYPSLTSYGLWNHGWEKFRLGLGLTLSVGRFTTGDATLDSYLPDTVVLPLPYLAMWWRLGKG